MGPFLCIIGYLVAFLASTHYLPIVSPPSTVKTKMSPDFANALWGAKLAPVESQSSEGVSLDVWTFMLANAGLETKNWVRVVALEGHLRKDREGLKRVRGGRADKGCVNELVTALGGKRLASLGTSGTVQNTPKSCPTEGHGNWDVYPSNQGQYVNLLCWFTPSQTCSFHSDPF